MSSLATPWITGPDIVDMRGPDAVEGIDSSVLATAAQAASEVLYVLTGRQFPGPQRTTLRPCRRASGWSLASWIEFYGLMVGSTFLGAGTSTWGWGYCRGGSHSECNDRRQVDLGVYPIVTINSITEDGADLDASAYHVESDRYLVRTDGKHWELCQDLNQPLTVQGTWSVDVTFGDPLPMSARSAAASLAIETGRAFSGLPNQLPQRVTSVNRQGVSWVLLDPMSFLENGKTGLYDVDLFIGTYNPDKLRQKPRVLSPDTYRDTRRISPVTGA